MQFELVIIKKCRWNDIRYKDEVTIIKKQVASTELIDLAYLQHQSENGLRNRENYIKNTVRFFLQNGYRTENNGIYYQSYVVFQSKMNTQDIEDT